MSAREEALAILRERFPEPWVVEMYHSPSDGIWSAVAYLGVVLVDGAERLDVMEAARACIAAWDEATKGLDGMAFRQKWMSERALADRLAEALAACGEHQRGCPWARFEAGRPTESGGYEMQYAGKWYEVKPNDRRPDCTCGLNEALAAHAERRKA